MADETPEIDDEPLEYQWRPLAITQIPAEMVVAMAQGLEEPVEIAARFGFGGERWEKLQQYEPFKQAVAAKKAELEKSGWVFRQKAAMQAEMLMDQVFVSAMSNDVGLMQKLETLKFLTKAGNLEPKEDKAAGAGAGFQIQINLGSQTVSLGNTPSPVVQAKAIDVLDIPFEDAE